MNNRRATRAGLLSFYFIAHKCFLIRNAVLLLENPTTLLLLYHISTEMRNRTRKSILKLFCTHPSQFHIKDGKFPLR